MYEMGRAELAAVRKVIESGQTFRYRGGEGGWCDQFEAGLSKRIGVKHAVTTSSGTAALVCGLVGLGVGPGDEVIIPAYTFMASAIAPLAAGAIPVIAEVDETLSLDPKDLERKITPYTRVIMPVYMLGRPCNMDAILAIARKHNLLVCEDACQAMGGAYHGRPLGSLGHIGTFSFNHFKIIACGEGGALVTDDLRVYDRALIHHDGGCVFRKHADKLSHPFFTGSNYRASEFQGAILCAQLGRLDGILKRLRARREVMSRVLAKAKAFRLTPDNDAEGDCGTTLGLLFDTVTEAQAFVESQKSTGLEMFRPIDSGRHVYSNWEPILSRQGSHHPSLNPYNWAKREITYSKDMCPATLDILSRTVCISVPYKLSLAQARSVAKKMVS